MSYVPLIDVSPRNGEAAVLFAALRSAGFDVEVECDIRGWMYWYKPFMSLIRPVTIWVPQAQLTDALGYLKAPVSCPDANDDEPVGFWAVARASRRPTCAAYLAVMFFLGG